MLHSKIESIDSYSRFSGRNGKREKFGQMTSFEIEIEGKTLQLATQFSNTFPFPLMLLTMKNRV